MCSKCLQISPRQLSNIGDLEAIASLVYPHIRKQPKKRDLGIVFRWLLTLSKFWPGLTDGVDVKKVNGRAENGAEHAVVKSLCWAHQPMKDDQTPGVAEDDGSCCET